MLYSFEYTFFSFYGRINSLYILGLLICSTLLATLHFCLILNLTFLLHIILNLWKITSSCLRGGLPIGRFQFLRYYSFTARVHWLSLNPDSVEFLLSVLRDHNLDSTPLPNYLASDMLMQRYPHYGSFYSLLYRNRSPFFLLCGSPHFACVQHRGQNDASEVFFLPLYDFADHHPIFYKKL